MVFVVDDDASVRRALHRLLRTAGCTVETFANAAEFLARRGQVESGCVVLDIRMPGISGLDLQERLAVAQPGLRIVIITGHGDDDVRQRALDAGAVAVLQKPFDEHVLLDAVAAATGRKGGLGC